jgi:hypothetical protein
LGRVLSLLVHPAAHPCNAKIDRVHVTTAANKLLVAAVALMLEFLTACLVGIGRTLTSMVHVKHGTGLFLNVTHYV